MPQSTIRRTKIVATLGPSWSHPDRMVQLLDAGVNVVRVNASHGTQEQRAGWIRDLQEIRERRTEPVAILVDLHGPRIRVGQLPEPRELVPGQKVTFAPEAGATAAELPTTYAGLAGDMRPGSKILLDDGLLSVEVTGVRGDRVDGVVRYGGLLRANKGMNLPGVDVSAPAVTEKDREEVAHAVELGVDYIGVSFVRRAEELRQLRSLIPRRIQLVAKIEKDTALLHLDSILDSTDAVMVARGDLGVELPFEEVPLVQKRLIREANRRGKPVITATQMLESMVHAPRPTRAETSDVANAILDGTDAVMLSAETAVGEYALEAVQAMDRIAREVERHRQGRSAAFDLAVGRRSGGASERFADRRARTEDAIAVAVCAASELLETRVIACFTSSGFTARTVASFRPSVPIVAVTPEPDTHRALSLVWGVTPVLVEHVPNYEAMLQVARAQLLEQGLVSPGDRVVVTAGVPFDMPGTTNLLKIETV
ncbi:MAG TPA: pyruvate kinase [Gemmatimonadales bacterium]|nr:pyruvate kinase [Gemmatimonadales bacterium]